MGSWLSPRPTATARSGSAGKVLKSCCKRYLSDVLTHLFVGVARENQLFDASQMSPGHGSKTESVPPASKPLAAAQTTLDGLLLPTGALSLAAWLGRVRCTAVVRIRYDRPVIAWLGIIAGLGIGVIRLRCVIYRRWVVVRLRRIVVRRNSQPESRATPAPAAPAAAPTPAAPAATPAPTAAAPAIAPAAAAPAVAAPSATPAASAPSAAPAASAPSAAAATPATAASAPSAAATPATSAAVKATTAASSTTASVPAAAMLRLRVGYIEGAAKGEGQNCNSERRARP